MLEAIKYGLKVVYILTKVMLNCFVNLEAIFETRNDLIEIVNILTKRFINYCSKPINEFYYTKSGILPLGNIYYHTKILIWRLRAKPIL